MKAQKLSIRFYLLVFLLLTASSVANCQSNKHLFGISLGYKLYANRDHVVSPLIYSGNMLAFCLLYNYRGSIARSSLTISYSSSRIESGVNNWMNLEDGSIIFNYHHHILSLFNNIANLFVGGEWLTKISYRNGVIRSPDPHYSQLFEDHDSAELVSALGISFLGEYSIDTINNLSLQVSMPVISYIIRPDYALTFNEDLSNGKFSFFSDYHHLNLNPCFSTKIDDEVILKIDYSFIYYSVSVPRKTRTVSNKFSISLLIGLF